MLLGHKYVTSNIILGFECDNEFLHLSGIGLKHEFPDFPVMISLCHYIKHMHDAHLFPGAQGIDQLSQTLNVWSIYLHLGSLGGKCR